MRKWAVKIRYLSASDSKWHRHTTKWHDDIEDAWKESDLFLNHANCWESSSSLIHKETN